MVAVSSGFTLKDNTWAHCQSVYEEPRTLLIDTGVQVESACDFSFLLIKVIFQSCIQTVGNNGF